MPITQLNHLHRLLVRVDDGTVTLPPAIAELRTARDRLVAATWPPPVTNDPVQRMTVRLIDESLVGPVTIDLAATAADLNTAAAATAARYAHERAVEVIERRIVKAIRENVDAIITEHFAPLVAEIVDQAQRHIATLGDYGVDAEALLSAPTKVRAARKDLSEIAESYAAIRSAFNVLPVEDDIKLDHSGEFAEASNMPAVWTPSAQFGANPEPPWPADALGRLHWLLTHGAQLWCPTAAERDAAFAGVYPNSRATQTLRAREDHKAEEAERLARARAKKVTAAGANIADRPVGGRGSTVVLETDETGAVRH